MNLQPWIAAAAVSTAILSVSAVIVLIWKVARSMALRARREAADLVIAVQASSADFIAMKAELAATRIAAEAARSEVSAMRTEVAAVAGALDEHITWHDGPGGRPAKPVPPQPNGQPRRRP